MSRSETDLVSESDIDPFYPKQIASIVVPTHSFNPVYYYKYFPAWDLNPQPSSIVTVTESNQQWRI